MNNNSNKSIMAIALVTIALVFIIGSTGADNNNVLAKKQLTGQERYDSGYKDGIKDCGNENIIQNYMQTSAYVGHSDLYHQGYVDGAYSCGGNGGGSNNNNDNSHLTSVSAPDNNQNGYSQNDNNNNRDQTQGQANNQHVVCIIAIGTCPTTSGQAQNLQN